MVYDCRFVLGFRLVYGSRSGSIRQHKIMVTKVGFHHIQLDNDIHPDKLDKDIKQKKKDINYIIVHKYSKMGNNN